MSLESVIYEAFAAEELDEILGYISPTGGFVTRQPDDPGEVVELTHFACWPGGEDADDDLPREERPAATRRFFVELLLKWARRHHLPRLAALAESRAQEEPLSDATWEEVARIWADAGYWVAVGDYGIDIHPNPLDHEEIRELLQLKAQAPDQSGHNAYTATEAGLALFGSSTAFHAPGHPHTGTPAEDLRETLQVAYPSGGASIGAEPDAGDPTLLLDWESMEGYEPTARGFAEDLEAFAAEHGVGLADIIHDLRTATTLDSYFEEDLKDRLAEAGFIVYVGTKRFEAYRLAPYVHEILIGLAGKPRSTRTNGSPHEVVIHDCTEERDCHTCPRFPVVRLRETWNGWASPTFTKDVAKSFLATYGAVSEHDGVLRSENPDDSVEFEPDENGDYDLYGYFVFDIDEDGYGTRYHNDGWPLDPPFPPLQGTTHSRSQPPQQVVAGGVEVRFLGKSQPDKSVGTFHEVHVQGNAVWATNHPNQEARELATLQGASWQEASTGILWHGIQVTSPRRR